MSYLVIQEFHEYAIVWMNREPVNTMDTAMWEQLAAALRRIEANPRMKGIAFMSRVKKDVFTAGNDILELYAPHTSKERYRYDTRRNGVTHPDLMMIQ